MEAFFIALVTVAVAELGDKSQVVAVFLSARYRRPWPVVAGLVLASFASHTLAVLLGDGLSRIVPEAALLWLVGLGFIAMAVWTLLATGDDADTPLPNIARPGMGPFVVAFVVFFMLELGDKTQLASMALAARFDATWQVLVGAALGMILTNLPAIWVGYRFAHRIPFNWLRGISALLFVVIGIVVLIQAAQTRF